MNIGDVDIKLFSHVQTKKLPFNGVGEKRKPINVLSHECIVLTDLEMEVILAEMKPS